MRQILPTLAQTFYVDVIAGAVGNSCSGQRVHFELLGPRATDRATASTPSGQPIYCYAINWNTNPPSAQSEAAYPAGSLPAVDLCNRRPRRRSDLRCSDQSDERSPVAASARQGLEIQIPVQSPIPRHGIFTAAAPTANYFDSWILDGNNSPHLYPHQGVFVDATGVNPGGGGGPGGTAGGTSQGLTANPQKPKPAAAPTGKRAAALKKCKKKKGSARKKCKKKALKLPV